MKSTKERNINYLLSTDLPLEEKLEKMHNPSLISHSESFFSSPKKPQKSPPKPVLWKKRLQENSKVSEQKGILNKVNRQGQSEFQLACYYSGLSVVQRLLKQGADINYEDWKGDTPLVYSIKSNNIDVVKFLLQQPELVTTKTLGPKLETPLLKAVKWGKNQAVKCLVLRKKSVSVQDAEGKTPLFYALVKGNTVCVMILLKAGATRGDLFDFKGNNALVVALEKGEFEAVKTLLGHLEFYLNKEICVEVLKLVCYMDQLDILKLLVKRKTPVEVTCGEKSVIFISYSLEFTEVTNYLLEVTPIKTLNQVTQQGDSLLFMAIRRNDLSFLKKLLAKKVDLNSKDNLGRTAIQTANELGYTEAAELLLESKISLDFQ